MGGNRRNPDRDPDVDPRDQAADGDPVRDPDNESFAGTASGRPISPDEGVYDPAELERNPDEPQE